MRIVLYIRASFCSVGTRRAHAARVRAQGLWILESGQWAVVSLHHLRPPSSLTSKSDWTLDIVCRCRLPAGSFQRPCIVVSFWRYDAACSFVVRTIIAFDLPRAATNDQRTLFVCLFCILRGLQCLFFRFLLVTAIEAVTVKYLERSLVQLWLSSSRGAAEQNRGYPASAWSRDTVEAGSIQGTVNPAPGFRPTCDPSRAREPENGPGSQNSAGCTKNQPRRPIIRPTRGHFVFLGPTAKRLNK